MVRQFPVGKFLSLNFLSDNCLLSGCFNSIMGKAGNYQHTKQAFDTALLVPDI